MSDPAPIRPSHPATQPSIDLGEDLPLTIPIRLARQMAAEASVSPPPGGPAVKAPTGQETRETLTPSVRVSSQLGSAAARATVRIPRPTAPASSGFLPKFEPLPPGSKPRLRVVRGQRMNIEYPVYEGANYLGRRDDEPIDIDLEDQEPPDRIWTSRRHAAVHFNNDMLEFEDLNSLNGTFVNRNRVPPGQRRALAVNDVIQVGTVQLRVLA
jgi:hypothetical protein